MACPRPKPRGPMRGEGLCAPRRSRWAMSPACVAILRGRLQIGAASRGRRAIPWAPYPDKGRILKRIVPMNQGGSYVADDIGDCRGAVLCRWRCADSWPKLGIARAIVRRSGVHGASSVTCQSFARAQRLGAPASWNAAAVRTALVGVTANAGRAHSAVTATSGSRAAKLGSTIRSTTSGYSARTRTASTANSRYWRRRLTTSSRTAAIQSDSGRKQIGNPCVDRATVARLRARMEGSAMNDDETAGRPLFSMRYAPGTLPEPNVKIRLNNETLNGASSQARP